MFSRLKSHPLSFISCLLLAATLSATLQDVALAQLATQSGAAESQNDIHVAVPVAFPGVKAATVSPALPPMPRPEPVRQARAAAPQQAEKETLMISRMSGEVHFKHLGGPQLDPSRALQI